MMWQSTLSMLLDATCYIVISCACIYSRLIQIPNFPKTVLNLKDNAAHKSRPIYWMCARIFISASSGHEPMDRMIVLSQNILNTYSVSTQTVDIGTGLVLVELHYQPSVEVDNSGALKPIENYFIHLVIRPTP